MVKSVHLEADVDEPYMLDETRHLLALAERADNPLEGIVACGRPESEDFKSYLDKIAAYPKVKGIRRVLHTQPDARGPGSDFPQERGCAFGVRSFLRYLRSRSAATDSDQSGLSMPGCCFYPRPLWRAPSKREASRPLALAHHGDCQVSKCLLQNLRPGGIRGFRTMDCRRPQAFCRTRDRRLRLGSRPFRERLARVHAFRQLSTMGRSIAGPDA